MNSPTDPRSDRRSVPRHLRDSEHELDLENEGGGRAGEATANAGRGWFYTAVAVVSGGLCLWLGFTREGMHMSLNKWSAIAGVVAVLAAVLALHSFRRDP